VEMGADVKRLDEVNSMAIDYAIDEKDIRIIRYLSSYQELSEELQEKINALERK